MSQQKQAAPTPNLDEVTFRNGVWVIVEKSTTARYGFAHGPYLTRKEANSRARKGGAKEAA